MNAVMVKNRSLYDPNGFSGVAESISLRISSGIYRRRRFHSYAVFQTSGIGRTQFPLGVVCNGRTTTMAEIKPMA